jgi:hypothetical protein
MLQHRCNFDLKYLKYQVSRYFVNREICTLRECVNIWSIFFAQCLIWHIQFSSLYSVVVGNLTLVLNEVGLMKSKKSIDLMSQ